MKREIKFRAIRIDNKEWCYGFIVFLLDPTKEENTYTSAFMHGGVSISPMIKVYPESVGQFSGLHDKNGKEIYEGDVVKNKLGQIGVYQWYKDRWEIKISDMMYSHNDTFSEHEIIGNIHQNPELL